MSAIYEALAKGVLASDGAIGTMLQERGLTDGGAPELWNVEKPEVIEDVLEAYAAAGANFITTNTRTGSSRASRGRRGRRGRPRPARARGTCTSACPSRSPRG